MMAKKLLIVCIFVLIAARPLLLAQAYEAPTRMPAASTVQQDAAIRAGAELHDQRKFDEAIARYQDVLKENPDNVTALYELAFAYAAKNDHENSLDTAKRGTSYKSELLANFYNLIGSSLDAMGQPQQAIEAYKKGIEYVPDAIDLYYNMAVTQFETLKDPDAARLVLERAVTLAPTHGDALLLLGQLQQQAGHRTAALLTLSRFLILRPAGEGSLQGYGVWRAVLRGGGSSAGELTAFDRQIATSQQSMVAEMDNGRSEIEALVRQVDGLLDKLTVFDPGAAKSSFAWTQYAPFFIELKRRNYVEPFVYWVSQRAPVQNVREWIQGNEARVREFLEWASTYRGTPP